MTTNSVLSIHTKELVGYFTDAAAMAQHAAHNMPAAYHNTQQQLLQQRDLLERAAALLLMAHLVEDGALP